MNLKMIQKVINAPDKYDLDLEITGISTNSLDIKAGNIFLTINSGYLYIDDAIKKGAVAIVTEKENIKANVPVLYVCNTKKALKTLASYFRSIYHGKVIAITGSNGKTSTKELLKYALAKHYRVLANPNSENNILGISKTLLKLTDEYDFLILELGMNHKGEIKELSHLIKPDIGIITNIGSSHIGILGSKENIFKAKMEILEGNSKINLYVNGDDPFLKQVQAIKVLPKIEYPNINKYNSALVSAYLKDLGYEEAEIKDLMESFPGIASRLTRYYYDKHIVIDDAYNASYESFLEGLAKLKQYNCRKIVIFGDMLELGSFSEYYHQLVYDELKKIDNVLVITIGNETKFLNNEFHFLSLLDLEKYLLNFDWNNDDIVYLKASHKINLSSLINFFNNLWLDK